MSDITNSVRLVSAGTGKTIPVPETVTLAELRNLAELSDDVTLAFNGETVDQGSEDTISLQDGDTVVSTPSKVDHG